jgi:uncharacterized protein
MMTEVWPVIHLINRERALRNAAIAWQCGCNGVFLISHFGDDDQVDTLAGVLHAEFPKLQIGVNYLTQRALNAVRRSMSFSYAATWVDDSGITSEGIGLSAQAIRDSLLRGHRYFASVAFKGQKDEPQPAAAARNALSLGFVPTTSGIATGLAPQIEKMAAIRAGIEPYDMLAVASGITPANVAGFVPYVTHILVSTGISKNFHDFDQDKLTRLMGVVSSQQRAGEKS